MEQLEMEIIKGQVHEWGLLCAFWIWKHHSGLHQNAVVSRRRWIHGAFLNH